MIKTSFFLMFSHFFSKYKYTLTHFQEKNFNKKLDKLFANIKESILLAFSFPL